MDPAYEYAEALTHRISIGEKTTQKTFPRRDQFAPELVYFSECVMRGEEPEPSGWEGLADVRVIRALYRAADTGVPVALEPFDKRDRPDLSQELRKPPVRKPALVNAEEPHPD